MGTEILIDLSEQFLCLSVGLCKEGASIQVPVIFLGLIHSTDRSPSPKADRLGQDRECPGVAKPLSLSAGRDPQKWSFALAPRCLLNVGHYGRRCVFPSRCDPRGQLLSEPGLWPEV